MDRIMPLFAGLVVIGAALATIAIWAPRRLSLRITAVGMSALLAAVAYGGLVDLLGRPKPVALELTPIPPSEATVIAAQLREPEAIYIWLMFDGAVEPRAYVLPWDTQMARQLREGMEDAEAQGTSVRMRTAQRQNSDPEEPVFFVAPQQALPPKPRARG